MATDWKGLSREQAMEVALMAILCRHEKWGTNLPPLHIQLAREALDCLQGPTSLKYQEIDAAAVINEICERRGISRKRLCEAINTKTSTLQRLMSGTTKSLNLTTYNKIVAWDNAQP